METSPKSFLDEPIDVLFSDPPALEKKPDCPQGFIWRGETYAIKNMLMEWHDFNRRGRMARNMRPAHAASAEVRGSWGVGRFFFRVMVTSGRIFDIYYDRTPVDAADRKGHWFLLGERELTENE